MKAVSGVRIVRGPLVHDTEGCRWYAEGGEACLVWTLRGRLLEPHPTFGPASYRVLAVSVRRDEAERYARGHGFPHLRDIVS
jgi:hypothetical protein